MNNLQHFCLLTLFLFVSLNVSAGGFVVVDNNKKIRCETCPIIQHYTLEQKSQKVEIKIDEVHAVTEIEQEFYNPNNRRMEGEFYFPIPSNAVINQFSMWINGREVQSELLDAEKARKIYQDIVRKYLDPALLEYSEQSLYKAKIFPIEANASQKIKISYTQTIEKDGDIREYTYALNAQKKHPVPIGTFSLKAEIQSEKPIKNVYSPTLDLEVGRKDDNHALIGFEAEKFRPKSNFKLYFSLGSEDLGTSLLSYKVNNIDDGYFYLDITPALNVNDLEIVDKNICFVLDCSGSMSGEKMEQAKRALTHCVDNLNENDKFNIVRFATEAGDLFGKLEPKSDANIDKAKKYINTLVARGGTNIDEALDLALNVESEADRPYMVVFITDGKPTIGVTQLQALLGNVERNNKHKAKIFTFGIGDDLNAHLLDKITELTNAYRTYISTEEDIELKISSFYNKVSSPVLTNLNLNIEGIKTSKIYPRVLPDLFQGSSLMVFGRYEDWGNAKILLDGEMNGEKQHFEFDAKFDKKNANNEFISPLWAARRIGYLLDQIRLNGEDEELKEEVVFLAKQFGIITPYTSHLIIEDETLEAEAPPSPNPIQFPRGPRVMDVFKKDRALVEEIAEEYSNLTTQQEGAASVKSSRDIMDMNNASNMSEINPAESGMQLTDKKGNTYDLEDQIKNVGGRAFYLNNGTWVDIYLKYAEDPELAKSKLNIDEYWSLKNPIFKDVYFNTEEYFDILNNNPELSSIFALGPQLHFYHEGTIYKVLK